MAVSGATRVAGVIGDPVAHSLSPVIHNAAFTECRLDWVYVAFPVVAGRGAAAVRAMRDLGIAGLNVTMPHKADAAEACDELTEAASLLRSVNTVVLRDDGSLLGESTDGAGLMRSLDDAGANVKGQRVVVVGAGGAARAIVPALSESGASPVVVARRSEAAAEAAALGGGETVPFADIAEAVEGADVVVNATPIGMGGEAPPFDVGRLNDRQLVVDLVYQPLDTPLLEGARQRGCRVVDGLGMLVHQAALSFSLWTGVEAPVETMRAAASRALSERS